eukprot:10402125-Prorocentrum_lima.AAC.1
MTGRQGEQNALLQCEQMEQLRLSEYHHDLRIFREERNQGSQYYHMEVLALQHMNTFQTQELNAQRGM